MTPTAQSVDNRELVRRGFRAIERPGSEDLVAVRTLMHGVHSGPMRELPPTGRPFAQSQSHWFRFGDGLIAEHWATRDDLGFLHQVGIVPAGRVGTSE